MTLRIRRLTLILGALAALLLLAVLGYTAYWFVTAGRLESGLAAWATAERAKGYDIAWSGARVTGFPTAFRIALSEGSLARGHPAAYRVTVPQLAGTAKAWDLNQWRLTMPQGAAITIAGIEGTIAAKAVTGTVRLAEDAAHITLAARDVGDQGALAGETDADITVPTRPAQTDRDLGFAARVAIYHLVLPEAVRPLGNTIESLSLDIDFDGPLPPGDWARSLAKWRDAGGTVELHHVALEWGALQFEANGTLALDRELQPEAALSAAIINHGALVDAAVAAHMLSPKSAAVVKLVLDLLAKRGPDGRRRLTAPVTIQDRTVSIDRAEIGKLPRITWQ